MRRYILIIALLATAGVVAAAQSFSVSGTVLDSLTRAGEPSSVVQFFKASDRSKPIAFATTDQDGHFVHTISGAGDYSLMFSNIGRRTVWRDFSLVKGEGKKDLGEILVEDDVQALSSASVTAQRTLVKMDVDKMTYDVSEDIDAKAATVLDMLRKVPMVTVDAQDNISVNGNSSFIVTVDGKHNPMLSSNASTVFKMMPASSVKEIQVITNPGVKYDAEGVGGVLNLVINKEAAGGAGSTDGFYATLRGNLGTREAGGGAYFSIQKGKFAMTFNGNVGRHRQKQYVDNMVTYADESAFLLSQDSKENMRYAFGNLSMSYDIDSLNLISATANLMSFPGRQKGSEGSYMFDASGAETGNYLTGINLRHSYTSIGASADYQHSWAGRPGQTLIFSYQFSGSPTTSDNKRIVQSASGLYSAPGAASSRRVRTRANSLSHTLQLDFTLPLTENQKISTGLKYIYRHNFSDDDYYNYEDDTFVPAPALGSEYDYYNRIGAAYAEYSGTFGKLGAKAGSRYEHTWQKIEHGTGEGSDFSTDYGNLVPSASLQYNLTPTSNIGLTYNLRLSRPGINYLNPYVNKSSPMFWTMGNSDLDVARSHNVSLVWNSFSPVVTLNISGNVSHTGNGIESYSYMRDDGVSVTTYGNVVKSTSIGASAFVNVNVGSKTRIYGNFRIDHRNMRSDALSARKAGWSSHVFAGAQETLPWDLRLSENLMMIGREYTLQGYRTGFCGAAMSLSKSFLGDKLTFSINAFSPLNSDGSIRMKMYSASRAVEGVSSSYSSKMSIKVPVRSVSFGVAWTFGSNRSASVKKTGRRDTGDDVVGGSSSSSGSASSAATQDLGI